MITTDLLHEFSVLFGLSIVSIQLNIVRFNFLLLGLAHILLRGKS